VGLYNDLRIGGNLGVLHLPETKTRSAKLNFHEHQFGRQLLVNNIVFAEPLSLSAVGIAVHLIPNSEISIMAKLSQRLQTTLPRHSVMRDQLT